MTDSQSRYSIVERLAMTKLSLLDAKANLDSQIQDMKQELENKEKGIEALKKASLENLERDISTRRREIGNLRSGIAYQLKNKPKQEKVIESKITEIDKALNSIQKISETAPTAKENA